MATIVYPIALSIGGMNGEPSREIQLAWKEKEEWVT